MRLAFLRNSRKITRKMEMKNMGVVYLRTEESRRRRTNMKLVTLGIEIKITTLIFISPKIDEWAKWKD